jgi:NAD(P)-dependent dehydrogenase (short-subunit alcohol dehydrogenase family)
MGVALVTGARRGIGRGIAVRLAEAGFDVAVNDVEAEADGRSVVAAIEAIGRRAVLLPSDIARIDAQAALLDAVEQRLGPVDCLVNNAGVSVLVRGDLLEVSEASYDRCLDINLKGTFFLTQAVARRMLGREGGGHRSIVTISSVSTEVVSTSRGEYCIAKAGLAMLTKLFAVRLAEVGIGVYEVRPGIIRTPMTAPSAERLERMIEEGFTPIRRWGEPKDVADAVAVLAQGKLPFTVGQVLTVDGGLTFRTL